MPLSNFLPPAPAPLFLRGPADGFFALQAVLILALAVPSSGTAGAPVAGQATAADPEPPGSVPSIRLEVQAAAAPSPGTDEERSADGEKDGSTDSAEENEDSSPAPDIEDGYAEIELLTRVLETVRQNYVDPAKVTYPRLMAAALRGMLAELDPHSQFMSPELFGQMQDNTGATYDGVGFTIAPDRSGLTIVSVREDGPAARAGVLPGDHILKLGDQFTEKLGYLESIRLLRGEPGEPLTLTVTRPATRETREFSMVREVLRQETVRDALLLDASLTGGTKIGYARLVQFNAPSARELADALDSLEDQGMAAFVLDLRNNPGGLLTAAVEILGEFLPPGTVVVTTEGRPGAENPPPLRTPARQRRVRSYPVVVVVNHQSASASELVAGALQDLGRAVIVGTTTFGKGSVQSIIPSGRGTAIRLTTARYFTPSHRMIHGTGIAPDLVSTLTPAEEKRVFESFRDRALAHPDPAALAKIPDPQLQRAVSALNGILAFKSLPPPAKPATRR